MKSVLIDYWGERKNPATRLCQGLRRGRLATPDKNIQGREGEDGRGDKYIAPSHAKGDDDGAKNMIACGASESGWYRSLKLNPPTADKSQKLKTAE